MLEFIDGQHPFGHGRGIEPIDALAAIQLIERLQVIPALQRQNRTFTLDPAFGLKRFVIAVRRAAITPRFILREGLRRLGIRRSRGVFIAVAQRQFRPQPPRQAAVAGVFEEGLGAGVIALLIIHRGQSIRVFQAAARAVLQQFDQFLFVRRLITK